MNTLTLIAQAGAAGSVGYLAICAVVVAGIIAIVYIGLRQAGVAIPPFVIQIFWVVAAVVLCVVAIKFLLTAL